MEVLFIVISMTLAIGAYALVSVKDQSYVNVLTPTYFTLIPGYFLLALLHIYFNGLSGSSFAYFFSYLTYALYFVIMALVYVRTPKLQLKLPINEKYELKWLPYVFLAASILIFLPVLIEFSDLIMSPRQIYMRTRTGYGHLYFVSTTCTFIGFVLCLFKSKPFKGEKVIYFIIGSFLCLMHGSKGQVVQLIFIAMMYQVFVKGFQVAFRRVAIYAIAFSLVLSSLFYLFSSSTDIDADIFLRNMAGYSDYTRNTMMLMDDHEAEPTYGRLTMETAFYSRIPRVLYPSKPKDWGTFYLAKRYYPNWFEKETGSPSFGMLGVVYSDFGYFSLFYLAFWGAVTGLLMRLFGDRVQKYRHPSDFIMLLFLAKVSVVTAGVGHLLLEHIVLAVVIALLLQMSVSPKLKLSLAIKPPEKAGVR